MKTDPDLRGVIRNSFDHIFIHIARTHNHFFYFTTGVKTDPDLRGVIPNSFDHIFTHIARTHDQQYLVRASYLEIYQVSNFVYVVRKRTRLPEGEGLKLHN